MERRSFLTLLPLMPMAGKLMVTMPKKYLGVEDLAAATKQIGPRLADLLFRKDPMLGYLRSLAELNKTYDLALASGDPPSLPLVPFPPPQDAPGAPG